ncbi:lipid-A-disaccharide synthase N-terminal domain-containing protein [Oceanomicrobium pacificus]|uniref:Lipid A biosynthesis protein n=1 Tax=Oceanomicrobium pacificus TaxID=2692916 RepID=A0A6B0TYH5_9RHOB|nr:lipid-A-disaccharide synthase N-terminal domain-containing protein [Oceanomicrobium pacificus]MXU66745.1 lipid A biosynthesis protein [Oceanomicrobium pacificus]
MDAVLEYLKIESRADLIWVCIGLGAQMMFSMRFIIQWLSSEKQGKSVVPVAFWWFSLTGGLLLLVYGIYRGEIVIILGQSTGIFIYARNLWLIYAEKKRAPDP